MSAEHAWLGRLFFAPGRLVYAGALGPTELHAHHAYQVVLAGDARVGLTDARGSESVGAAAAIGPDIPHAIAQASPAAVLLYIDPDDRVGRLLRRSIAASGASQAWVDAVAARALPRIERLPATWAEADGLADQVLRALVGEIDRPRPVHPAVTRVLRRLGEESLDGDLRLPALARVAGLSPSRLAHVFSAEVGIPLRPYVLWCRLMRAAARVRRGDSLAAAAHHAGFADGAHLTHVFKRMFGIAPSSLLAAVEWLPPPTE